MEIAIAQWRHIIQIILYGHTASCYYFAQMGVLNQGFLPVLLFCSPLQLQKQPA
jgi:hypothetical protein